MVTKRRVKARKPVTKGGRPPLAGKAMSGAERVARHRAKARPPKSADEIFEGICASRNLTTPADLRLAELATAALVDGDLPEAIRALDALPPAIHARSETPTLSAEHARAEILRRIMNLKAADVIERAARIARGDPTLTERDRLQYQLDKLDEQAALPAPDERAAGEPADEVPALRARIAELEAQLAGDGELVEDAPAIEGPKVIPSERVPRDDWNHQPVTVLDIKPTVLDAGAPVAAPAPAPTEPDNWDQSDNGRAWHSWRASGGYNNGDPNL